MSLQGTEHPCGIATSESTSAARTCCWNSLWGAGLWAEPGRPLGSVPADTQFSQWESAWVCASTFSNQVSKFQHNVFAMPVVSRPRQLM